MVHQSVLAKDRHDGVIHYRSNYQQNRQIWWLRIVRVEQIPPSCQPIKLQIRNIVIPGKNIYHNAWNPKSGNEWFPGKPIRDVCARDKILTSTSATTTFSTWLYDVKVSYSNYGLTLFSYHLIEKGSPNLITQPPYWKRVLPFFFF